MNSAAQEVAAYAAYPSLRDRVVFITGGASGIGAAMVEAFHGQGARVAFVDKARGAGQALAARLPGSWFRLCDVTYPAALQSAVDAAAWALGPITVLVNNVADDAHHPALGLSPEAWRRGLAVNLDPAFITSTRVAPAMAAAGGGTIINLGSINALLPTAEMPDYVAAKGAISALTKSLAREWGVSGIRVNAIMPGWVVTARHLATWLTPELEAEWMMKTCLKHRILPDDVARAALFLAADDSRMITGQDFIIDGGRI